MPKMWLAVAFVAVALAEVVTFVVARAREIGREQERYQGSADLRRADDHDPNPPFDDTAGWV